MKEQGGNCRIRNLIAWFSEKATNLWNLVMHKNLFWTLLFIGYCCFRSFFERLLTDCLVFPFLSSFEVTFFTRILFVVGVIYIIVRTCFALWNEEQISPSHLYIAFLLIFIWGYYRFCSDAFTFTYVIDNIAFVDIVALYAVLLYFTWSAVWVITKISSIRNEKANQGEGFVLDEPIHENPQEDILKRSPFAESIANKLLRTKLSERSFAIGIVAPWGYGKTSFVNLIKYHLGDRAIVMDYSPWVYGKGSNLTQAFFAELSKKLSCYNRSLNHQIKAYASLLGKTDSTMLQLLSSVYALFHREDSLETAKETLEKTLQSIPKPIVVVVDDLDRLIGEEIMEVLQLMRNGASFPNLYFIAAYDKNYMVKTISEQNKVIMSDIYLEKIFQIEYTLPAFEHSRLIEYLNEECDRFIRDVDKEELRQIIDGRGRMKRFVKEELLSMRDVKRYANSLQNSYEKLAGNVVLCDLMNLEILRLMYKPVYDLLSLRWEQVLMEEEEFLRLYESSEEREKNISWSQKVPSFEMNVQLKEMGYSEVEAKHIIRILNFLFPSSGLSKVYGAINNKDSIARYFYDAIQDYDLPIEVFKGLWNKDYQYIKEEVDNIMARYQTASFVKQLDSFTPDSVAVCKKKIRIMFYVGSSSNLSEGTHKTILSGIISLDRDLSNDAEIKELLWEVIKENGLSNYVSEFLYSEYHSLEKYFSFEEIRVIETDYLQEAIRRDLPLNMIYDYMGRAIYKGRDYEKNDRANTLFKEYADRHVEEFLQTMVRYMIPNEGYYSVSFFAKNVWGEWGKFIDYVKSITPRTPVIDEFEEFLEEFVEHGTQNAIPYKFKHIKIERR